MCLPLSCHDFKLLNIKLASNVGDITLVRNGSIIPLLSINLLSS